VLSEGAKTWVRSEAFDQSPVCISVIDLDFRIVEANRQFTETYGAWIGRPCYSVYKGREIRCTECAAAQTFADGQTRAREERGRVCNGRPIDYLVHMVPLIRADGVIPFVIEMSTDITEMKRLERDKLEAERLAAVGQTVAGLAHGIKNIVMGLEGGMYVMGTGIRKADSERIGLGWEMLEENIARISAFVKEFLEFARGREPKVALVDSNEIAHKLVDLYRDGAGMKGITLREDFAEGIADIAVDGEAVHTCLANLVSNAVDACEMSDKRDHSVTLTTREKNGAVIFEVVDDGCGMDYEVKQKVFTNFFSTKGSDKGTGLGLLTTRKIIQEHGGTISFDSTEGVGSVFRITLPRDRLPKASPPRGEAEERSANSGELEPQGEVL
jgi:PAS domain S-box-containing protein